VSPRNSILVFVCAVATVTAQAPPIETEEQALAVLASQAPDAEKQSACLRLKQVGTARSVPALKALLAEEDLSQWAVDALQSLPAREAGEALLQLLPSVPDKTRQLIIFALGARRESAAVNSLSNLLAGAPVATAAASAQALGNIGDAPAHAVLHAARFRGHWLVREAVERALLAEADRMLSQGQKTKVHSLYAALYHHNPHPQIRAAAFRGMVLSKDGATAIVTALSGYDETVRTMALQLVRELPGEKTTQTTAAALPKFSPLAQVAVIEALRQRGDPFAAKQMATLARSGESSVRTAALRALGELGDASHVRLLANVAASATAPERTIAGSALTTLHRGKILECILAEIRKADTETRLELIRTLARRMERASVPELFSLASGNDATVGVAAIQSLEKLADDAQMLPLLGLITRAPDDARRVAAVSAFTSVGARGRHAAHFSAAALKSLPGAASETRAALLEAAGLLGGPGVHDAMMAGLRDTDAQVHATALRVMADNSGDEARLDLLRLARESGPEADRALALRGYWRLVEAMSDRSQAERFAAVSDGLAAANSPADLKLGLARLAELRGVEALELATRHRREAVARAEAESACLQIATRLGLPDLATAEATLRELAREAGNANVRTQAAEFLARLEAQAGSIAPWFVSGSYRQPGKEASQLFEVAFPPESPRAGQVEWRPLPLASSLTNYGFADLGPVTGGDHCVVYLKARVFCPKELSATLDIGTDDGVKIWINGSLIHANNAVRGFTAGQDKSDTTLKEGWNEFLVKVTQHTAGCAAAIRVRDAGGQAIPGLRVEAMN